MKVNFKALDKPAIENVDIVEATVEQNIKAERIAGSASGLKFTCALLSLCATFDGNKLLMEDLMKMPQSFFLALMSAGVELPMAEKVLEK